VVDYRNFNNKKKLEIFIRYGAATVGFLVNEKADLSKRAVSVSLLVIYFGVIFQDINFHEK
jgi:hypothetical protein